MVLQRHDQRSLFLANTRGFLGTISRKIKEYPDAIYPKIRKRQQLVAQFVDVVRLAYTLLVYLEGKLSWENQAKAQNGCLEKQTRVVEAPRDAGSADDQCAEYGLDLSAIDESGVRDGMGIL